jgi:hypothetical protein
MATASRLFSSSKGVRQQRRSAQASGGDGCDYADTIITQQGGAGGTSEHEGECAQNTPEYCPAVEYLWGARDMADAVARYGAWQVGLLEEARARGGWHRGLRFLVFTPVEVERDVVNTHQTCDWCLVQMS